MRLVVAKRNYFRRMAVDRRWTSLSIMLSNREFLTIILSDKVLRPILGDINVEHKVLLLTTEVRL